MKKTILGLGLCILATGVASAGTICPAAGGTSPFAHAPDAGAGGTGCNAVITISQVGSLISAVTTVKDALGYDASEDNLVGVLNNSSIPISSLTLTGSGIFGLDGDGICAFTFVGSGYCATGHSTDPADYYGPTSTFSIATLNSGVVNFSTPIAAGGGVSYFSLELPPTANLNVVVGGGGNVPEPATTALMLGGLAALALKLRRKRSA